MKDTRTTDHRLTDMLKVTQTNERRKALIVAMEIKDAMMTGALNTMLERMDAIYMKNYGFKFTSPYVEASKQLKEASNG